MPTVQQWGRKESLMWPPRGYLYTLGALFLACIATGFFVYLRFQYGLSPLEKYYLPYYLRSETAGLAHPASTYQMLYVSDGVSLGRPALDADVQPGSTVQSGGKPLPLMLTPRRQFMALIFSCASLHAAIRTRWFTHGSRTGYTKTFPSTDCFQCS